MTITTQEMETMKAGIAWAKGLKAGDTFRGSYGEARHRGLSDRLESCFGSAGFAFVQGRNIVCNQDNVIVSID
jgi:hypothetical protein